MSSTLTVECGPPVTQREGSYPQLRNRSKIAKGCHLSSVTRLPVNTSNHSFDPNVCPVQGSSLLCVEPSREYKAPQNSPRNNIPCSPRNTFKEEQSTPATPEDPPEDERPLSVVGEGFSSLPGTTSRAISRVSSYVPPSRMGTAASLYKPPKDLSEMLLAYDDSGEGEPSGPPPTPSECSISSFKVDGLRIGSMCETRCTQSSRDFNPGYVKRTSYCCDKCAERMTCHESLVLDSSSPFYACQRYRTADDLERYTSQYNPISDNIQKFLESSLSCSLDGEQKRQFSRLWGSKSPEELVKPSPFPNKEEFLDGCNASCSSSCKTCGIQRQQDGSSISDEDAFDEQGEQEVTVSDLDDKEPLTENKCGDKFSHVDISEHTTVDKEIEHKETMPDLNNTTKPSEKAQSETEKPSFWSSEWKPPTPVEPHHDEEGMGSPCKSMSYTRHSVRDQDAITLPSIYVKTKPKSGLPRTTDRGIDKNSNTCDGATPKLQDKSQPVFDSAKVKQVLQECADIIDVPKRQFLPELPTVPDSIELCYTPIVDKRYNRWKRRRRKRNKGDESGYKTVSPCESSSEENRDNMNNDSPLSNVKLRRRRKLPDDDDFECHGSHSNIHDLHYDASCEFTSSDKDFNSYNTHEDVTLNIGRHPSTIEEHKERIRTAIEHRSKDTLQPEVFHHGGSYSARKEEHGITPDLGNALLQTSQVIISRKPNLPPPQSNKTEEEENLTKTTPKLPYFKAKKTTYARKSMPFQEDQSRFSKPIDRSLVYHASSDSGAIVKLSNSNPSGDSPGQSSSGLVRVRMDKASKERLLLSRMARQKIVTGNLIPRKRPASEVKLPSGTTTKSNISNLSLNHLLQTIPNRSTSKNKLVEGNDAAKKQDTSPNKDPGVLAPEVVGLQKKHEGSTSETPKKEKRSPKRKCTFPKKPLLDMMNKAYFREIERKVKNREINRLRNVSSLSFTPSFSYSLFELPEIYKKYNKAIENRVSMAWPVSQKLK